MKFNINAYQHFYLKHTKFQEIWKSQNWKFSHLKKVPLLLHRGVPQMWLKKTFAITGERFFFISLNDYLITLFIIWYLCLLVVQSLTLQCNVHFFKNRFILWNTTTYFLGFNTLNLFHLNALIHFFRVDIVNVFFVQTSGLIYLIWFGEHKSFHGKLARLSKLVWDRAPSDFIVW